MQSQNQGPSPPKPDTYDRYKVFCLKDHILSAKKKRGPSHITFWIFRHLWPIGIYEENRYAFHNLHTKQQDIVRRVKINYCRWKVEVIWDGWIVTSLFPLLNSSRLSSLLHNFQSALVHPCKDTFLAHF